MSLITKKQAEVFDLSQIERGYLLWGKHCTWPEGRAGFVTSATQEQLIVQYFPGISNVTNHFMIPAAEAAAGLLEIRWSADMTEIQEYGIGTETEEEGVENKTG